MTALAPIILLLAQETTSPPSVGERFTVLLVVSAASAVLAGLWLLRRWSRVPPEGSYCSPAHLWRELCGAH